MSAGQVASSRTFIVGNSALHCCAARIGCKVWFERQPAVVRKDEFLDEKQNMSILFLYGSCCLSSTAAICFCHWTLILDFPHFRRWCGLGGSVFIDESAPVDRHRKHPEGYQLQNSSMSAVPRDGCLPVSLCEGGY